MRREDLEARRVGGRGQQRAGVALADAPALQRREHLGGQFQQPQPVCHLRPRAADAVRRLLLGHPEVVDQPPVGARLLDRAQVLALDVLDQRQLQLVAVGRLAHGDRHARQARGGRGAQPPLAGDQPVAHGAGLAARQLRHQQRLDHSVLAHRLRQLLERRVVHLRARLVRIRLDLHDRDLADGPPGELAGGRAARDQRAEAASEASRLSSISRHREPPLRGVRVVRSARRRAVGRPRRRPRRGRTAGSQARGSAPPRVAPSAGSRP